VLVRPKWRAYPWECNAVVKLGKTELLVKTAAPELQSHQNGRHKRTFLMLSTRTISYLQMRLSHRVASTCTFGTHCVPPAYSHPSCPSRRILELRAFSVLSLRKLVRTCDIECSRELCFSLTPAGSVIPMPRPCPVTCFLRLVLYGSTPFAAWS